MLNIAVFCRAGGDKMRNKASEQGELTYLRVHRKVSTFTNKTIIVTSQETTVVLQNHMKEAGAQSQYGRQEESG